MKKTISIVAIVAGALTLLSIAVPLITGFVFQAPTSGSVGIIGGADGPTAIMIAKTVGASGIIVPTAAGILLIATGIWGFKRSKK